MPLGEITGRRPTTYSRWHRPPTLPARCCYADIDCVEVRENRVVAFIETIQIQDEKLNGAGIWIYSDPWLHNWYPKGDPRYPLWETKKCVLNFLFAKTNKPIFIVYHTPNMEKVRVIDFRRKTLTDYPGRKFAAWLQMAW